LDGTSEVNYSTHHLFVDSMSMLNLASRQYRPTLG
jgi:hypothetical protein